MIKFTFWLLLIGVMIASFIPVALAQPENPLAGTYWQLKSVDSDSPATMRFESDGRVTGSGGCNRFSGKYTIKGGTISFSEIVSTLMICEGTGDQETVFFNAIQSATRFEVSDDQLIISDGDDESLTFVPDFASSLIGTQWVLLDYANGIPVIPDVTITLEFRPENDIVGVGGCNEYSGTYQLDGAKSIAFTEVITTLKDCIANSLMDQERDFLNGLREATQFEMTQDRLIVKYGDGLELDFALIDRNRLVGTRWQLVSYGNPEAETAITSDTLPTLEFVDHTQVSGSGGCNRYSGTYTHSSNMITFSPIVRTEMACADATVMSQETSFFQWLESASYYEMTNDQLLIGFEADSISWHLTFVPLVEGT